MPSQGAFGSPLSSGLPSSPALSQSAPPIHSSQVSIQDPGSSYTVAGCWPIAQEEAGKASPLGRGFRGSLQIGTPEEADLKSSRIA